MHGRLVLLMILAALLGAAPANAQLRALGTDSAAPVLFGDRVLWTAGADVMAAPVAGGPAAVFGRVPRGAHDDVWLAAGPDTVAVELQDWRSTRADGRLFAAGADGVFRQLSASIGGLPVSLAIPALSVTAAGVMRVEPRRARLHDGSGRAREVVLPPGAVAADVAAAGSLGVATTPDGALVVFDLRSGTEQRQIALGRYDGTFINGLAISPEGDVAVTLAAGDGNDVLLWAPAGATRVQVLSSGRSRTYVATARGRVAFVGAEGERGGQRVTVIEAATRRTVFRGPVAYTVSNVAFDGSHVAFTAAECVLAGPADPAASRRSLPEGPCVRSDAGVNTEFPLVRDGRYRAQVTCLNAPDRSCRVDARLRTRSGALAGRSSTRIRVGSGPVLAIRLNARGRRERSDRLRMTVTLTDPDGRRRVVYDG